MNKERFERQRKYVESEIDPLNIDIKYWSDVEINSFFDSRIQELEHPIDFIEANKWQFENFKHHRPGEGHSDDEMAGLFIQREKTMSLEAKMKAAAVRSVVEEKQGEILEKVQIRLAKFLPSWQPQQTEITFKIMEDADYRHPSKGRVEVDLWRLSFRENPIEDVIEGIIHELVHEWMGEGGQNAIRNGNKFTSREEAQTSAYFKISDEGLAVLVSGGESLARHYEEKGEDYATSISKSFQYLSEYLTIGDVEDLKRLYRGGLDDMGPFYVVGYEMASKVLEQVGIERFREIIIGIRENPKLLFDEYKAISGG